MSQFRQIMITSPAKLSLKNDSLVIKTVDGNQEQALSQLSTLLVDMDQCIITTPLLSALNSNHVNLVITNRHHLPTLYSNKLKVNRQFNWHDNVKLTVWQAIIHEKFNVDDYDNVNDAFKSLLRIYQFVTSDYLLLVNHALSYHLDEELVKHLTASMKLNVVLLRY